ncbi:hypothetical protein CDIK_3712 [Cucumispora dikerogammari]|nr:hypothetical protein CDIK_3712 [Cucumispora dikerogammari]
MNDEDPNTNISFPTWIFTSIFTTLYDLMSNIMTWDINSLFKATIFTTPPILGFYYIYQQYQQSLQRSLQESLVLKQTQEAQNIKILELKTQYENTPSNNELNQLFFYDKTINKAYICEIDSNTLRDLVILISAFKVSSTGLHISNNQLRHNDKELKKIVSKNIKLNLKSIEYNEANNDISLNLRKLKDNNNDIRILMSSILRFITHPKNLFNKNSEWKFQNIIKNFKSSTDNYTFFHNFSKDIDITNEVSNTYFYNQIINSEKENKNCLIFQLTNSKKQFIGFYKLTFSYEFGIDFLGNKKLREIRLKEFKEKGVDGLDKAVIKSYIECVRKVF